MRRRRKNERKVQEDEKMQEDKRMQELEKEEEGSPAAAEACNTAGSVIILRRREGGGRSAAWRPHLMRSRKESTVSFLVAGSAPCSSSCVLSADAPAPGRMMKPRATARPEASSVVPKK